MRLFYLLLVVPCALSLNIYTMENTAEIFGNEISAAERYATLGVEDDIPTPPPHRQVAK